VPLETVDLIHNGDFEVLHELWREQISSWQRRDSKQASVSDLFYHSIRYSLRTNNGSVWQIVPLEPELSNLTLSFWLYLQTVPSFPKGRTIAGMDVWVHTGATKRAISYYVFGEYRYKRENVKDLFIPDLQRDRWNYVVRNLEEDFGQAYPDIDLDSAKQLNITLWAFLTPEPVPYWDDISLTCQRGTIKQTPLTTPEKETTTPTSPPMTQTSTPETSTPSTQGPTDQPLYIIAGVLALLVAAAILVLRRRSRQQGGRVG